MAPVDRLQVRRRPGQQGEPLELLDVERGERFEPTGPFVGELQPDDSVVVARPGRGRRARPRRRGRRARRCCGAGGGGSPRPRRSSGPLGSSWPRIASRSWCWAGVRPAARACCSLHRSKRRSPVRKASSRAYTSSSNHTSSSTMSSSPRGYHNPGYATSIVPRWNTVVRWELLRPPPPQSPSRALGDFTTTPAILRLVPLAVVVGALGAGISLALLDMIGFFTNLFYYQRLSVDLVSPDANTLGVLAVVIPVGGGLVVGLMARFGSEQIRGHGIPEAMERILINGSQVQPRLAVLKPISSAISIGTGGPFGAEGPIILTGGAVGSVVGQLFRLTAAQRRSLLVAGAAAGHERRLRHAGGGDAVRRRAAGVRAPAAVDGAGRDRRGDRRRAAHGHGATPAWSSPQPLFPVPAPRRARRRRAARRGGGRRRLRARGLGA